MVISVNRRLFRYFGSYSGISVIPVILVNRRTPLYSGTWFYTRNGDSRFLHGFTRISRLIRKPESIYAVSNVFEWRHIFVGSVERF